MPKHPNKKPRLEHYSGDAFVHLAIIYRCPDDVKPHPGNARTHSPRQIRQIADSIKAFGFNVPLLLGPDDQLIAGHGRLAAARLLGVRTVPTIRLSRKRRSRSRRQSGS